MGKICKRCGTENDLNAKFCMNCAAEFSDEEIDEAKKEDDILIVNEEMDNAPKPKKKMKFSKKKAGVALAVVVVLLIIIGVATSPKPVSISATYDGDTEEGVVLDNNNDGFTVIGTFEDGAVKEISGWKIEEPVTLQEDETSQVQIAYKDVSTKVEVECSTSAIESINVEYYGDSEAGVVLDENNSGFTVRAVHQNGTESVIDSGWKIENPVTLEADTTASITVSYEDFSATVDVSCSTVTLEKITAKYTGDTEEGVTIGEKKGDIEVTAHYKNGSKETVDGWTANKEVTLEAGKTAKIKINYMDKQCTLKVKCTTITEEQYKEQCKSISYDSLARDPDKYEYDMVKFTGRIIQVMDSESYVELRINVTNDGYGYYDDTVYVTYMYEDGDTKFLEDDIVTFYGTYFGLYTYESVLGASITIPEVFARYIDIE